MTKQETLLEIIDRIKELINETNNSNIIRELSKAIDRAEKQLE